MRKLPTLPISCLPFFGGRWAQNLFRYLTTYLRLPTLPTYFSLNLYILYIIYTYSVRLVKVFAKKGRQGRQSAQIGVIVKEFVPIGVETMGNGIGKVGKIGFLKAAGAFL